MSTDTSSIEQFALDNVPDRCTLSSAVIEHALLSRGHDVQRYSPSIVMARLSSELIAFENLNGPDSSLIGRSVRALRDVQLTLLARSGLPVPRWSTFTSDQQQLGRAFAADRIGWPVAVRPARLAPAKGSTERVTDDEFAAAWRSAVDAYEGSIRRRAVVVEEAPAGERFHVFVVGQAVAAVAQIVPAHVIGDGRTSIAGLIDSKNAERVRNPFLGKHPVPRVVRRLGALRAAGRRLADVPADGERVELGANPTVVSGGDLVDATDRVPPELGALARRAVAATPGLAYAAVDIVARPPGVDGPGTADSPGTAHGPGTADAAGAGPARYLVTRVDGFAAPLAHFPSSGTPRDVAGAIVDHYLGTPRWKAARRTGVESVPEDVNPVEPLCHRG